MLLFIQLLEDLARRGRMLQGVRELRGHARGLGGTRKLDTCCRRILGSENPTLFNTSEVSSDVFPLRRYAPQSKAVFRSPTLGARPRRPRAGPGPRLSGP